MKKISILTSALLMLGLTSCFDLDKTPEGVLSTANPFNSVGEMRSYVDQFYQNAVRNQSFNTYATGGNIAEYDVYSDNMSGTIVARINGDLTVSNASALSGYQDIRKVNFLINNSGNCAEKGSAEYNKILGEAYYFRAWYYYQMFINYGPLTWVDRELDPDMGQLQLARDSRTVVADNIIADLDKAIELLDEKNSSASMLIHKDVARALKSEVALFEGTWEKYHKAKNDAFYDKTITDEKIKGYLQTAIDAAEAVVNRGVWAIYTGAGDDSYRELFQTENLSSNPEVLWFKRYDASLNLGNHTNRYLNKGGGCVGLNASLIDDYLTIDGKPYLKAERTAAKKVWGTELSPEVRDHRLAQTVCTTGQVLRPDMPEGYKLPPLHGGSNAWDQNLTGYSLLKYVQIDFTGNLDNESSGNTPAIQFRYADILLNLAEAYAELDNMNGNRANDAKIIAAVQPLRDRAGLPAMDFDREFNSESDYPFKDLPKTVQAVRRERRVEKACEGRRFEDILRWAAADVIIKGMRPKGVLFKGTNLEAENVPGGFYDGKLVAGQNIFLDDEGYVLPINPASLGAEGYGFKVDRDYLLPIQQRMISVTNNLWEQNPGW